MPTSGSRDAVATTPGESSASPMTSPVVITVCRLLPGQGSRRADPGAGHRARSCSRRRSSSSSGTTSSPDGSYRRELSALAADLDLDDCVVFTGRRSDVARLMAAADVFAMPSLEEPFGLVYLEAMAMQLPVVALDSGGTPEVVEHGRSGLLCPPRRPRRAGHEHRRAALRCGPTGSHGRTRTARGRASGSRSSGRAGTSPRSTDRCSRVAAPTIEHCEGAGHASDVGR